MLTVVNASGQEEFEQNFSFFYKTEIKKEIQKICNEIQTTIRCNILKSFF